MRSRCRVREKEPASGEDGEKQRGGTSRPSLLPGSAEFVHTSTKARPAVLNAPERGTTSGCCLRPVAGLIKIDDFLIALDRPPGRARRRAPGPVPQLQVAEDLLADRAFADQADDFERSAAAGTNRGPASYTFLVSRARERLRLRANSSARSESCGCGSCVSAGRAGVDGTARGETLRASPASRFPRQSTMPSTFLNSPTNVFISSAVPRVTRMWLGMDGNRRPTITRRSLSASISGCAGLPR